MEDRLKDILIELESTSLARRPSGWDLRLYMDHILLEMSDGGSLKAETMPTISNALQHARWLEQGPPRLLLGNLFLNHQLAEGARALAISKAVAMVLELSSSRRAKFDDMEFLNGGMATTVDPASLKERLRALIARDLSLAR